MAFPIRFFLPIKDPYGNYVIQSALTVSSGQLHRCARGVTARPHVPAAAAAAATACRACFLRAPCLHTPSQPPHPPPLPLTSPRSNLVDAIRPHLPALRGTPHGKRILAKVSVKL